MMSRIGPTSGCGAVMRDVRAKPVLEPESPLRVLRQRLLRCPPGWVFVADAVTLVVVLMFFPDQTVAALGWALEHVFMPVFEFPMAVLRVALGRG